MNRDRPGRSCSGFILGAVLGLALDAAALIWLTLAIQRYSREHPGPAGAAQGAGVIYLLILAAAPVLALIGGIVGQILVWLIAMNRDSRSDE